MRILGIDPGSAICGWGVVEKNSKINQLKLVECGCIKTHKSSSTAERLRSVYLGIQEVINKYNPAEVAVEELFFVQNVKTGIVVGQARGVLLLAAAMSGKPVFEYKPTQIKLALVGYGRADKKQVQNMVKLVLKLDKPIAQDDTADAVAIALCHAQQMRYEDHPNTHEYKRELTHESGENKILYPDLSYAIVGALYDTFNKVGAGLPERYYYSLFKEQLNKLGINYQEQVKVNIEGLPIKLGRFYLDFIIDGKIVVELKVGSRFYKQSVDQIMAYLRQSGLQLGILARFGNNGVSTKRFLLGRKV